MSSDFESNLNLNLVFQGYETFLLLCISSIVTRCNLKVQRHSNSEYQRGNLSTFCLMSCMSNGRRHFYLFRVCNETKMRRLHILRWNMSQDEVRLTNFLSHLTNTEMQTQILSKVHQNPKSAVHWFKNRWKTMLLTLVNISPVEVTQFKT